jgi:hypothetical protein
MSEGLGRTAPTDAQQRLLDDSDASIETQIQTILASRRRTNASGQDGEDISNIRAALGSVRPNVLVSGAQRPHGAGD